MARLQRSLARASGADADRLLEAFTAGGGVGALAAGLQQCLAADAEPAARLMWDPRRTGAQPGSPSACGPALPEAEPLAVTGSCRAAPCTCLCCMRELWACCICYVVRVLPRIHTQH